MQKDEIADILKEIGVFLELKGENPFKTRAYQNGARTLEGLAEPLDALIAEERLGSIKGIGKALAEKITELATTGRLAYYDELKASIPDGLIAMLDIPGLGPKKVKAVHSKLGIETVEALEQACKESQLAALPGFGKKTEAKILEGIEFRRNYASHHHISTALNLAEPILEELRAHPDVIRCSTAGSLRRHKEIVRDIDFLVSSKKPKPVIDFFTGQAGILSVSVSYTHLPSPRDRG